MQPGLAPWTPRELAPPVTPAMYAVNKIETEGIEHLRLGELGEAERNLMQALKQREAQHPDDPDHSSLSTALNNLAVLHLKQHRLEESAAGFERVIRIKERAQQLEPSSRAAMEISAAKNNLDTVRRFQERESPLAPAPPLPPNAASFVPPSPASAASSSLGWARLRELRGGGSDSLKSTQLKHKERIAKSLGVQVAGKKEGEIDELIRRSVRGDVDTEATRILVDLAFELLDVDGNGVLSRIEVLRGMKEKPQVREMLQIGPFADPVAFNEVYTAIDADGSNSLDKAEFQRYFMRKLAPAEPPLETAAERQQRLVGGAAFQFKDAGRMHRERASLGASLERPGLAGGAAGGAAGGGRLGLDLPSRLDPTAQRHYRLGTGTAMSNPEVADLSTYDDLTRGLESAHRRRLGLQQDLAALQKELHAVEADIVTKGSAAERVRQALASHRNSHSSLAGSFDDQIRRLDERARLAMRPDMATGGRSDRLR